MFAGTMSIDVATLESDGLRTMCTLSPKTRFDVVALWRRSVTATAEEGPTRRNARVRDDCFMRFSFCLEWGDFETETSSSTNVWM
jgi:hypothetical protein